jgi:DNA replication licensing factor MCM4
MGIRVNANMRTVKNIYRTYLDVIGYVKTDKRRYEMGNEDGNAQANENRADDVIGGDDDENMGAEEEMDGVMSGHDAGFSEEEVQKFKEFAAKPEVYDLLSDALAPSIWECNDVKRGILCQLFGGCSKEFKR